MPDAHLKLPQEVATQLDISPATLRRWSDEFVDFLSSEATSDDKTSRRYTDADFHTLSTIKQWMTEGSTYEQTRQRLSNHHHTPPAPTSLVPADEYTATTAINYFGEVVDELRQGQMSVLNSQAANRELMGVVIQDNFSLKEENNRLRERMLELERQLALSRRDEEARRESLRQEFEAKLMEVRELATRNPITILQSRSGCLGGLFGGGTTVQTIGEPAASPTTPPAAASRPHPRPPGPPE